MLQDMMEPREIEVREVVEGAVPVRIAFEQGGTFTFEMSLPVALSLFTQLAARLAAIGEDERQKTEYERQKAEDENTERRSHVVCGSDPTDISGRGHVHRRTWEREQKSGSDPKLSDRGGAA